jgi:hypothetical protein
MHGICTNPTGKFPPEAAILRFHGEDTLCNRKGNRDYYVVLADFEFARPAVALILKAVFMRPAQ